MRRPVDRCRIYPTKGATMSTDLKDELRERICAILSEDQFQSMGHTEVSRALVGSAFAWRDFNGGIDDTRHAAKCLHDLVDEEAYHRGLNGGSK